MKILATAIIIMSTSAILYIKENDHSPETPTTILNEDIYFDCPYVYNTTCNPEYYEFYLNDLQQNSELSTIVNFSRIQSTILQGSKSFVIRLVPGEIGQMWMSDDMRRHSVNIPTNVEPWEIAFSLFVGKSNDYYYLIFPPGPLNGQYNFTVTMILIDHPPSFYSRTWWIIGLYFLTLFLIPVVINQYCKSKYRTYRIQKTEDDKFDINQLLNISDEKQ